MRHQTANAPRQRKTPAWVFPGRPILAAPRTVPTRATTKTWHIAGGWPSACQRPKYSPSPAPGHRNAANRPDRGPARQRNAARLGFPAPKAGAEWPRSRRPRYCHSAAQSCRHFRQAKPAAIAGLSNLAAASPVHRPGERRCLTPPLAPRLIQAAAPITPGPFQPRWCAAGALVGQKYPKTSRGWRHRKIHQSRSFHCAP